MDVHFILMAFGMEMAGIRIRVHMQDLGHPIIGDGRYGGENSPNPIGRLALHAFKLCFYHPVTRDLMEFETPYPADFKKLFLKK